MSAAVVVAGDAETVVVIISQLPLRSRGGGGELEVVEVPTRVVFWILPVMVSLLQSSPERDETAKDDDDNDDDYDGDHGPSGLRWKHNNILQEEQRSYL